jgi:hypothetical protein
VESGRKRKKNKRRRVAYELADVVVAMANVCMAAQLRPAIALVPERERK